ncbi:MAG: membrane protein insertion efficiency factor YidD [Candidatus Omnitrophica bacterium]|nr:membrane protein insertion efficiency factor YidD [Candidatus Omnitrophota bacterium]MDD5027662.1 membrane protein insertion efficiency factor YidD [Candidatus Omnitrophota bacterium]MDD5661577.1 membrane protein insertion efficiency factor YidD [Candidatus Omnitrophota bacterium]
MLSRVSLSLIKVYQLYLRGCLPVSCRFHPTCSEYMRQAIVKYGFWIGFFKGAKRLLACHPFSGKFGYHPLE